MFSHSSSTVALRQPASMRNGSRMRVTPAPTDRSDLGEAWPDRASKPRIFVDMKVLPLRLRLLPHGGELQPRGGRQGLGSLARPPARPSSRPRAKASASSDGDRPSVSTVRPGRTGEPALGAARIGFGAHGGAPGGVLRLRLAPALALHGRKAVSISPPRSAGPAGSGAKRRALAAAAPFRPPRGRDDQDSPAIDSGFIRSLLDESIA